MQDDSNTLIAPDAFGLQEIQQQLRKLERRDWWLWATALVIMLLLTIAVFSLSFPELLSTQDTFLRFNINRLVRGLAGLVILFNGYTVYQQIQIKRLRTQLSDQLDNMGRLQVRAQELHRLATVDPLTGLYNRRFGEQRLVAEIARARRNGHALSVVFFDLNDFKDVNDRYGHAAGDEVLCEFARRLVSAVRVSDFAVRMGGDEFMVILPECSAEQARRMVDRVDGVAANHSGHSIPVQSSAGSVGYDPAESPEQFLERADRLLYENKRARKAHRPEGAPIHSTLAR
ncbi:MAG TPA: GGDEF domain-containing protein [Candidatus Acidoferrales bacterium]|nr:GGDEF domain-containing protein [Candidatus Acidoferrales bacterium]